MKEFVTPILVDLDINETAEGNFAGSGSTPSNPIPTPGVEVNPTIGCWINWTCTWTGHNNGGHSVCNVTANHCGDHSGNCLVMNFTAYNFSVKEVKNASGCTVSNVSSGGFTITRNNHFNNTESIGFNFEIVTDTIFYDESGNPLHGAIGANNASSAYLKVTSYTCN